MNKRDWHGMWVPYDNEEEKQMAMQYLNLWKYFFLKQIYPFKQIGQDQFVERNFNEIPWESIKGICNHKYKFTLGLKIEVENDKN